jgi:hypothetical protein
MAAIGAYLPANKWQVILNSKQPTQNSELTEWARFAALLPSLLQKVAHGT